MPRKRRLTRAEAKARTRELLLEAAARAFARKGFAGASVEEIAEDAGYTIGALYSNFSGKDELFMELMASRAQSRVDDTAQLLAAKHGTAEAPLTAGGLWTALGQQMTDVADKDMEIAPLQAEFWLYAVRHPEVMAPFAAQLRQRRAPLERLIAGAMEHDGGRYPDGLAGRAATVVSALFQGMVRQRRIDPGNVPPELYGDALRWLSAGIKACESLPEAEDA